MSRVVEVAVELPVRKTFHYRLRSRHGSGSHVGMRLLVPFGRRGISGVVVGESDAAPEGVDRLRDVDTVFDNEPAMTDELIGLCLWVARYYEAAPGEVLRAARPTGSRVKAVEQFELTAAGVDVAAGRGSAVPPKVRDLCARLAAADAPMRRKKLLEGPFSAKDLDAVIEAGFAERSLSNKRGRVRAKTVRVAVAVGDEDAAEPLLLRAPARRAVWQALLDADGRADVGALAAEKPRASAHLRSLQKLGLVRFETREVVGVADVALPTHASAEPLELNEQQRVAFERMRGAVDARDYAGFLLHGITGSGKTEIYLQVIAHALEQGKSAIVLVPEISLTPQLAARFRARFGDDVAVLHSGLTDRERFDEWQRLASGSARIALGARSAIFAPVENLAVVVVDEEHDSSFKQEEGVRYHARDVALVRAKRAGAVCVLGSATPSLESFAGISSGRLERLELRSRATARPLPSVELIDMRSHQPDRESMLTAPLREAIEHNLEAGDQTILFMNRRGFETFVLCVKCGDAVRCNSCSVSLTYHKGKNQLLCHYCGFAARTPTDCQKCGGTDCISRRGVGTEKIAESVMMHFPSARVGRLDRDVVAGRSVQSVLSSMARRELDILVGTQMVTKGHDFPGVTLVGVLCADTGLSLPDFRASERTFQLLTQVAGRAGRGERPGRVLIQSYRVDAVAVAAAKLHDYHRFADAELLVRKELSYPPFGHLIALRVDGTSADAVARRCRELGERAHSLAAEQGGAVDVLGPCEAPLSRIKGRTRWHLWLRASDRKPLRGLLSTLLGAGANDARGVRVAVDVDPISAL